MTAIRASGATGLRTSDAATIAKRDRKTVRVKLQAAVLRGEPGYQSKGPLTAYVPIEPA